MNLETEFANLRLYKKKYINYIRQYIAFKKHNDDRFEIRWDEKYLCLNDAGKNHEFDPHYIYHTAWAARILKDINPKQHIDIGSALYFSTIVSAFIPVKFYDYRRIKLNLSNLDTGSADLNSLSFDSNSIESLSCMHTVEHIGLGRYGDPIDPKGDLKAVLELKRVVKPKGNFLFVIPVGIQSIKFNAHRIYSFDSVTELFDGFELMNFSLITDNGSFIDSPKRTIVNKQEFGCGCFWYKKK